MTLAELQAAFHALATRAPGADLATAGALLAGTPGRAAEDRARVYADMYLWRLVDALRSDFPKLAALLGDEAFFAMAAAYAAAHPSDDPDLGRFGRHLPAWLRDHPASAERSDLADLAALEWSRGEVFVEAEVPPAGREAFATVSPDAFGALRLRVVPALRVLALDHHLAPLWAALDGGKPPPAPEPRPTVVAVWRSGVAVLHTTLDSDEATALHAVATGAPLGEAFAAFEGRDEPAADALAALLGWLDDGWIAALATP